VCPIPSFSFLEQERCTVPSKQTSVWLLPWPTLILPATAVASSHAHLLPQLPGHLQALQGSIKQEGGVLRTLLGRHLWGRSEANGPLGTGCSMLSQLGPSAQFLGTCRHRTCCHRLSATFGPLKAPHWVTCTQHRLHTGQLCRGAVVTSSSGAAMRSWNTPAWAPASCSTSSAASQRCWAAQARPACREGGGVGRWVGKWVNG
jgi:hypothetical protein